MKPNNSHIARIAALALALASTVKAAITLESLGRAHSVNMYTYLDDQLDWDQEKMYLLQTYGIERWGLQGDNITPESRYLFTSDTTGDKLKGMFVHSQDRVIIFSGVRFFVLDAALNEQYAVRNTDTNLCFDGTNRYQYDKIYDLGGYTDRFIMRLVHVKNNKNFYRWAVVWIDNGATRLGYRLIDYIQDNDPIDIVAIRRGAAVAILNRNKTIYANELMDGNQLWFNNLNIGNPLKGVYIAPKCELVTLDNMQRLRIFDTKDGRQKTPPPIEWVNHTFRDMNVVRDSDKIEALTNRRVMVIDASEDYEINQFRNTSADPAGQTYRYHRGNNRNEWITMYEDLGSHKNFRGLAINGGQSEVCHPDCLNLCSKALRYCSTGIFGRSWFWFKSRCHMCNEWHFLCGIPDWAWTLLFLGLLANLLALLFLCVCCCRGNGTRDVHTVENYSRNGYIARERYLETLPRRSRNKKTVIEETTIQRRQQQSPSRVYRSGFSEQKFVDRGGPAMSRSPKPSARSRSRLDRSADAGSRTVVVEETINRSSVNESYNPYKRRN